MGEADLEVGNVLTVDAMSGENISEPIVRVRSLASTGVTNIATSRKVAFGHWAVAGPTLTAGSSAAVTVRGTGGAGLSTPVTAPSGW